MDIKAFGTYTPAAAELPYGSGLVWTPADGPKQFPTCRAISVIGGNSNTVFLVLNDAQGQYIEVGGFANQPLLPVGATNISGGNITSAVVLY